MILKKLEITRFADYPEVELKDAAFKGINFPNHFHETYSIALINGGFEKITLGGKDLTVCKDIIVVINEGEVHANGFYDTDEWSYQTINISPDLLRFFAFRNALNISLSPRFKHIIEDPELVDLIRSLKKYDVTGKIAAIEQIICRLIRYHRFEIPPKNFSYPEMKNVIMEMRYLIRRDLNQPLNLFMFSKLFGKSTYQILRAFKSYTGLTPGQFKNLNRINKAKSLIKQGCSLTEVAMECGYYDQSHFIHSFNQLVGVRPGTYKSAIKTF